MQKKLLLVLLSILLVSSTAFGQTSSRFAVGGYAGLSIPLLQDDQGDGSAFGFKARFSLLNVFVVEPNFNFDKWGSPAAIDGVDLGIDGSKVTSYGVDLVLGNAPGVTGISPYFVAGVASYKIKNESTSYEETGFGWSAGLGIGASVSPRISIDIRGKFLVAPQSQGSKKGLALVGGLNFNFGSGM